MAIANTLENNILDGARIKINIICQKMGSDFRFKALAMVATGISCNDYNNVIKEIQILDCEKEQVRREIIDLKEYIQKLPMHPTLALCSLAREEMSFSEQKQKGVYYTDYRLASFLANSIMDKITPDKRIIDTASGTGILLLAVALQCKGIWSEDTFNVWVRDNVYACDISPMALIGVKIAFLSLVSDQNVVLGLEQHLFENDSLQGTFKNSYDKYDIVIGNPPWGKIKLTRHLYMAEQGVNHIYGTEFENFETEHYKEAKAILDNYSKMIRSSYELCEKGEIDLYMPFLELSMNIIKSDGFGALLIPAGFIRSQGTEALRRFMFENFNNVSISVFDNKDRYFTIDTRFKFLCIRFGNDEQKSIIRVIHPIELKEKCIVCNEVAYSFEELEKLRPDLSVPELYTREELSIFAKMVSNGVICSENGEWNPYIVREVDMTSSAKKFSRDKQGGLPVIEGRMVHNYRLGAKSYICGQGRSAKWGVNLTGCAKVTPQFTIKPEHLPITIRERTNVVRAGFCDIAGQTNERAMMAALIPAGVVCGNKVPTITFEGIDSEKRVLLWIGIVNSFAYDWFLRRVLTTTVNYFLLKSIPLPNIDIDSQEADIIIKNTKKLFILDKNQGSLTEFEELRRENDCLVAKAYGLTFVDMKMILSDFPLLDRGQPALNSESKSTITQDMILWGMARLDKDSENISYHRNRVVQAQEKGAKAFMSAEEKKIRK